MRVLITGVKGQLGYDCVRELKERGFNDDEIIPTDIDTLDIINKEDVFKFVQLHKPNVIMHNAAYTAVDKAESEGKEIACIVNELGTNNLAQAAEMVGAKLVYISTDYVFPGNGNKPFEVDDEKGPLNIYGSSKLDGEKAARKCSRTFIVRISWVFGLNGNNFVKTMLKLGESHKELTVVCDQIGSPTYTRDLAKLLCDMIETEKYGTYHATNEGLCSWAEFAQEIFKQAKMDVVVHPITTEEYLKTKPQQAKRPLNSRLSKKSLDDAGFNRLPTWQDALARYLKELGL